MYNLERNENPKKRYMLFDVSSLLVEAQKSIRLGRENASDHWPLETGVPSLAGLKSSSRLVPSTCPDTFSYGLNVAFFSGRHSRSSCPVVMVCANDSVYSERRGRSPCPQRGISRSRISAASCTPLFYTSSPCMREFNSA